MKMEKCYSYYLFTDAFVKLKLSHISNTMLRINDNNFY